MVTRERGLVPLLVLCGLLIGCGGRGPAGAATGGVPQGSMHTLSDQLIVRSADRESTTTTTSSVAEPVDETEEAFTVLMLARAECGRNPWTCDTDRLAVPGTPTHVRLDKLFDARRAAGIIASGSGGLRFRIDGISGESPDVVMVEVCLTDDTVLVDSLGQVFDDGLFSARMEFTMSRVDSTWLWSDDQTVEYTYGEDLCAFGI